MSTRLSPPGKCHMVLCSMKEKKNNAAVFFVCACMSVERQLALSQGRGLLVCEAHNLASSTPDMRYCETTQMLRQQYQFFRPILHKHTFYIEPRSPHTLVCPPPFRHCNHSVNVVPANSPRLNTRELQRLQHTPCSL